MQTRAEKKLVETRFWISIKLSSIMCIACQALRLCVHFFFQFSVVVSWAKDNNNNSRMLLSFSNACWLSCISPANRFSLAFFPFYSFHSLSVSFSLTIQRVFMFSHWLWLVYISRWITENRDTYLNWLYIWKRRRKLESKWNWHYGVLSSASPSPCLKKSQWMGVGRFGSIQQFTQMR